MNYFINAFKYLLIVFIFIGCSTQSFLEKDKTKNIEDPVKKSNQNQTTQIIKENLNSIGSFPIVYNSDVNHWIQYFQTKAKRSFITWTERGRPFKSAIEDTLESEGVPGAFYYMSLIESGFILQASSHRKASGPWQFIKSTGELYGLKSNSWIDQRRDPVKSTHAAAAYLRDLNSRFNDWYLTLAAYNCGPKLIQDAMKKSGLKDFWALKKAGLLKRETGEFVPKMIAATIVGSNPQKYNLPELEIEDSNFPNSVIYIKDSVRIDELAKKLSVSTAKLKEWNPELLKNRTPPKRILSGKKYPLRVDKIYVAKFTEIESQLIYHPEQTAKVHHIAKKRKDSLKPKISDERDRDVRANRADRT